LKAKGLQPVLFGAPWEAGELQAVASLAGFRLPLLTPDLPGLAACLAGTRLVVANDSGPLHVAAAVGVPCVGLYGPVDPRWSAPMAKKSKTFYTGLDCSPCHAKICPLGHHRCLEDVAPAAVSAAVSSLLGR
jgi:heptosyltransferase-2